MEHLLRVSLRRGMCYQIDFVREKGANKPASAATDARTVPRSWIYWSIVVTMTIPPTSSCIFCSLISGVVVVWYAWARTSVHASWEKFEKSLAYGHCWKICIKPDDGAEDDGSLRWRQSGSGKASKQRWRRGRMSTTDAQAMARSSSSCVQIVSREPLTVTD